jgi:hypothetical protein
MQLGAFEQAHEGRMAIDMIDIRLRYFLNPRTRGALSFAIRDPQSKIENPRGHSSVGRAPALQAGSQGFESPCLQSLKGVAAKINNRAHFRMH